MANDIAALFWDVGGVVLSNGWEHTSRAQAARRFGLDPEDLETRHQNVADAFETGRMTLEEYLDQTVFFRARPFSRQEYRAFIFAQSEENPETRLIVDDLAAQRYRMATLNNESAELNLHRIRTFHLARTFSAFFSSCYLGVRKPDERLYRLVLDITQRPPEKCIFVDDRPANLEPARRMGMTAIHFQSPAQLRADLARYGVYARDAAPAACGEKQVP